MSRRFTPPKKPKRFKNMDLKEITSEHCGRSYDRNAVKRTQCAVCEMDVMLHCGDCELQITGCLCTAIDRMSPEEFAQFKGEYERKRAAAQGIWLPGQN